MKIKFTKMQALGNDYIFVNGWNYPGLVDQAKDLSIQWCERRFGIGGDGVIFVLPSKKADMQMRIFNTDGSEAEMCGNGIRQAVKYVYDNKLIVKDRITVDTLAGTRIIDVVQTKRGKLAKCRVDMGAPILDPVKIPSNVAANPQGYCDINMNVADRSFRFTLVSMGNPHAVAFIDDVETFDIERYGKIVENLTYIFPRRTNVEFARVEKPGRIRMRVWERGSGETLACGTGACATLVAAVLNGKANRKATIMLTGGPLEVEWVENGNVIMAGGAQVAFTGAAEFKPAK